MGVLVGLGVGIGLMLVWSAFFLPRRTRRPSRSRGRVGELLARAGLGTVSASTFTTLCVMSGFAAALVMQVVTRTPPVAVVFGLMGGFVPVGVVSGRARRRQRDFAEVWPEAVDNLASAVRAGLSLPDALAQLAVRGPEPLRDSFDAFALDYQVTGRFGECLDRLKERLADPVGDRVVEGLRIAREVGGGEPPPAACCAGSSSGEKRSTPPGTTPFMERRGVAVCSSSRTFTLSNCRTSFCSANVIVGSRSAARRAKSTREVARSRSTEAPIWWASICANTARDRAISTSTSATAAATMSAATPALR
jgi:hypothetical protein